MPLELVELVEHFLHNEFSNKCVCLGLFIFVAFLCCCVILMYPVRGNTVNIFKINLF